MDISPSTQFAALNLPKVEGLRVRRTATGFSVWDKLRGRWLVLTPEEWVRQHFIGFLISELGVQPALIAQEVRLGALGRADIVVYDAQGVARMVVECKAPHVSLSQQTLDQAGRYNCVLGVEFVAVTNGLEHLYFQIDHNRGRAERINCPKNLEIR